MGNSQSSSDRPNRLSKPKTNTNSPGPALVVDSPVSVSSRYADFSTKGRQPVRETLLSPTGTDFGSRAWTNKDDDVMGDLAPQTRGRPLSVISRTNSRVNSRSNSMSCFGSKHGSTTKLNELHGSKISLVSNTQADLDSAIRLLQEVKKNASPEDLAALQDEAIEFSEDATVTTTEQGLSRRTSTVNRSSSSLTRRRSLLQTPGVATRSSPVEGRRRTWNSWKAPKVAPEEEAKWAVTPKGITPLNRAMVHGLIEEDRNTPTPRAQTPGELDYAHLGSLKLGTLSIVNGAPSPAPSAKITQPRSLYGGEVDYFTAAESGPSPLMMKTTRRGHIKSKSSVLPVATPFYDNDRTPDVVRTLQSASRPDYRQEKQASDIVSELEPVRSFRVTNKSVDTLRHDAVRLAEDYQANIPDSPFDDRSTFSGAENEEVLSSADATTYKQEEARIFAGTGFDAPMTASEASGSALFPPAPPKTPADKQIKANQRPAPRTADSGYSSGGSLRVSERSQKVADAIASADPSVPRMEEVERSGSEISRHCPSKHDAIQVVTEDLKPMSMHNPDQSARSSISGSLVSPTSPRSITSKSSFDSTSSGNQKRLQRRRSAHPEPPIVQSCQPIPEGTIPEIPDGVRAKFTRRLSNTPGMECLTHTYESKDHVVTNEPNLDTATINPAEVFAQMTELEPERPLTPPPHGRRQSLFLFRRKSTVGSKDVDHEEDNGSPGVVDLGTIASSLGSSPYDAAMSKPLRKTVTSPTHPHQLGAKLPRAKSMVGMDSEAAAEFARMHSRDRALAMQEMPPQRRRSYHNLKLEAGEAKAAKRRPHSSQQDIPPVPLIDSSKVNVPQPARPRVESEHQQPKSDLSFSARSQAKEKAADNVVSRLAQNRQSLPQHNVDWEAHSNHWRQRRKSIGEGLRTHGTFSEASASTINSRNTPQPRQDLAAWGRFSGGLDYNYEGRGAGVGGSAGTRQLHSAASSKSLKWRHQYGVDLSDVPIMLQRA